jgi:acyl dehydratase
MAIGTYDALDIGASFRTPERKITDDDVDELVGRGGYTHPLFADPAFARRSPFGRRPLPGQAVLLIMGGLAEQTGTFDESVIALLGFDEVRFVAPAFAGDTIHVDIAVTAKELRADGRRGVLKMLWTARNADDRVLVVASASMLFNRDLP